MRRSVMRSSILINAMSLFILSLIIFGCSSGKETKTTEDLFNKLAEIRRIGEERNTKEVKYLVREFETSNSDVVRIEAANALGKIGDPRAIPALERSLRIEKKQNILSAAESALESIQQQMEKAEKEKK
ncbi:hypothetical protein GF337_19825 [candidate division KSB1 bacterium]|nr:hypothetical protein [candidate division KSB1 bacterium]